jgi:hypothetical protein
MNRTLHRLLERAGAARIRSWREHAQAVVAGGFAVYATGFLIEWVFAAAWSRVLTITGGIIVALGAAAVLLWLVDVDSLGRR